MTTFLRLLAEKDKGAALAITCARFRAGKHDPSAFQVAPESFRDVPGAPFAYWVSDSVRGLFKELPAFEGDGREVRQGLATADDFRFVRAWWEVSPSDERWPGFAKGGAYSPYYADIYLVVNWFRDGAEIRNFFDPATGKLNSRPQNTEFFRRRGLTWSDRTTLRLSPRPMPANVVFSVKGSAGFFAGSELSTLGLMNSDAFNILISLMVGAGDAAAKSYQVGTIGLVPFPGISDTLSQHACRSWSLKRTLDTVEETSHAFLLPTVLLPRLGDYDPPAIEAELALIQAEIDAIAFDLYGFSPEDRAVIAQPLSGDGEETTVGEEETEDASPPVDAQSAFLSWAIGVAFGRFDIRLATGERDAPPEPEPFDPLPAISPGMLPEGEAPFHSHLGILVDDAGDPHDLARQVEAVLERVEVPVPQEVRGWLRKSFFPFHLQQYSKSRRKAPIYWPLSTPSGAYTLWLYYPSLSSQTLYTALNDFIEPKLQDLGKSLAVLRGKGAARSSAENKELANLQDLEIELIELRNTLQELAPSYRPNHDDGVQITAAPLWPLFRHKPWQKVLKETWDKLKKGDYDWAHLALHYWPERVREKCKTDKSIAIAHGLEELYIELPSADNPKHGRKKTGA